jgi:hypothetical protein
VTPDEGAVAVDAPGAPGAPDILVRVENVAKAFGATQALRDCPRRGKCRRCPRRARPGDGSYVKAPMPVMARPTMSVCMVSVPSKV